MGVGTVIARQISCQIGRWALVILHNYFGNISLDRPRPSHVIITYWLDGLADKNEGHHMSKYTPTMIEKLSAAQPLNLAKAQTFASEFGVSHRSIIAKALSLGLTYEKKAVSSSSSDRPTKADLVREIEQSLQGESLDGLQGASMRSLQALIMSIG